MEDDEKIKAELREIMKGVYTPEDIEKMKERAKEFVDGLNKGME